MSATDLGQGPVVVLLHAFPVNRQLWLPVAELLAADGWRVIVPDLPGFGDAPVSTREPDVAVLAEDVLALMDDLGVVEFAVAGLSMGGYVVMALLRLSPRRLRAIALVDTKMAADSPAARDNRFVVADRAESEGSTEFLVDAMMPMLVSPTTITERPDVVASVADWIRSTDPAGVAWAQRAMAARPDSSADLAGFDGPAVVLAGADDVISPVQEQYEIAAVLADSELVLVPTVGHLSAIEDPHSVATALASWARRSVR